MTIPVMIHLPVETFKTLETIAARKGMAMRDLIVSGLERSVQPRPAFTRCGHVPAPVGNRRGVRKITDADWVEVRKLKAAGWSAAELAIRFGVSSSTIYKGLSR